MARKILPPYFHRRALGWGLGLLMALPFAGALQGCATPSRAQFCVRDLPMLETDYDNAILALGPWLNAGRSLASSDAGGGGPLPEADRQYWMSWAHQRLKTVQVAMDLEDAENRGHVRRELSFLATELVSFHGYSQAGRSDRLAASLRKLQAISRRLQSKGCAEFDLKKT